MWSLWSTDTFKTFVGNILKNGIQFQPLSSRDYGIFTDPFNIYLVHTLPRTEEKVQGHQTFAERGQMNQEWLLVGID